VAVPAGHPRAIGALATFFGELLLGISGAGAPAGGARGGLRHHPDPSGINLLGARPGSAVQTFFTVVKVAALLV
jgi:hypothetical protein